MDEIDFSTKEHIDFMDDQLDMIFKILRDRKSPPSTTQFALHLLSTQLGYRQFKLNTESEDRQEKTNDD